MKYRIISFILCCFIQGQALAEVPLIRLGLLPFGTVSWEINTLQESLKKQQTAFQLQVRHVATPQAGKIALISGAVDVIVVDWIWVSRQRASGTAISFYPYSNTAGALMVKADSPIRSIAELSQVRLGIAGGELDKNWLLLQALALGKYNKNLDQDVTKVFAAPALLNEQMKQQRVDAMMNYWHYAARLEAQGYRQLINGKGIQKALQIKPAVPSLGYVFNSAWAEQHSAALTEFLSNAKQAREQLCTSDAAWEKIVPLTKAADVKTQQILRERYCQGRIESWGIAEQQAAQKLYQLLKKISQNRLTGAAEDIAPGTFWQLNE